MDTRFMFLIVIVLFYSCKEKTTSNTTFYKSSNSAFNVFNSATEYLSITIPNWLAIPFLL